MERREDREGRRHDRRLDELETRAESIAAELSYRERLEYEERHGASKDARLAEGRGDVELDEAVDGSFPASDPASPARASHHGGDRAQWRAADAELDEALDDTFPASDPPAILAPKGPQE